LIWGVNDIIEHKTLQVAQGLMILLSTNFSKYDLDANDVVEHKTFQARI
jgi:hypothetical protein